MKKFKIALKTFTILALAATVSVVILAYRIYNRVGEQANYTIPGKGTSEYNNIVSELVVKAKKLDEYKVLLKQINSEEQRVFLEKITKSYMRGSLDFITPNATEKFVRDAMNEIDNASECIYVMFGKSGSAFLRASFSKNSPQYLVALENSRFFAGEIISSKKLTRDECVTIFKEGN